MKKLLLLLFMVNISFGYDVFINSFNAGELTPYLEGRPDIVKYYSGCRTLDNFLVLSHGGVTKRPGTYYVAPAKYTDRATRLVSFEYSTYVSYILEFGDEYIRFFYNGSQILDVNNDPYEIVSPYDQNDLFDLQFVQSADTMYIADGNYPVYKLTRSDHDDWDINEVTFNRGTYRDQNKTDTTVTVSDGNSYTFTITLMSTADTITISGQGDLTSFFPNSTNFSVTGNAATQNNIQWSVASTSYANPVFTIHTTTHIAYSASGGTVSVNPNWTSGDTVTLDSSTDIWNTNHIGAMWSITHILPSNEVKTLFTANGNSVNSVVQKSRTFHWTTHGTWSGTAILEKSYDDGTTWLEVKPFSNESESNISFNEEETVDDAIYRVRMMNWVGGACNSSLIVSSFEEKGEVKITTFIDANTVIGTVQNTISLGTATKKWAEGAFSEDEGYPNAIAFFEERLVLGGTKNQPQTIWMSISDDWENFYQYSGDDTALVYTIASNQLNSIQWLMGHNALMIGTRGGEWKLTINDDNIAKCYCQSTYGSALIQPIMVNNVILYVQRQARKIREMAYNYEQDSWVSPDLTVLAEHVIKNGVEQVAFSKEPDPMLWTVTDSNLAVMTYNREQEVMAWQNVTLDGEVRSCAIIPREAEDEVWVLVDRTIDGNEVRYIERFMPRNFGDVKDAFFVDCGLTYDGGDTKNPTAITKAYPCVVTCASHGFTDGEQVRFSDVNGMTELDENVYTVQYINVNSFSLRDETDAVDINSVGFTTYVSGSVEAVDNTFVNLSHLEGEVVQVVADGGYYGDETVTNGTITLDDYYNTVHIGKRYTAKLVPQRLEFQGSGTMTKVKNIRKVTLRLKDSLSCKIGYSWTEYEALTFREMSDPLDEPVPLFSGDKESDFDGDYSTSADIYIQNDEPLPLTILCLAAEVDIQQ